MNRELESAERQKFSPKELEVVRLFRSSFEHSQGSGEFHYYLFEYLAQKGYLEGLPIPEKPPAYVMKMLTPPKHHSTVSPEGITLSVESEWGSFYRYAHVYTKSDYAMKGKESLPSLINYISSFVIKRDTDYQATGQGRKRSNTAPTMFITEYYDSQFDPHASLLRRYAILQKPAGYKGFDKMYQDISAQLKTNPGGLQKLVQAWENNHPYVDFFTNKQIR